MSKVMPLTWSHAKVTFLVNGTGADASSPSSVRVTRSPSEGSSGMGGQEASAIKTS